MFRRNKRSWGLIYLSWYSKVGAGSCSLLIQPRHLTHVLAITLASLIKRSSQQRHYYKMWVQFISPCSHNNWIHSKSSEITWCIETPFVVVRGKRRTKRVPKSPSEKRSGSQMGQGTNYVPKPPHQSQEAYQKRRGNPERAIRSKEPSPAMMACVKIEAPCTLCNRSMFPPSGHSEPAPTSAPSTGYLLLLSCGWTSTQLIFGSPW